MRSLGDGQFTASAFFIDNQLHLFNDFTHYLVDPVHGDQEDQFENRRAFGGQASYTLPVATWARSRTRLPSGLSRVTTSLYVGRLPSEDQVPLPVDG